MLVITGVLRLFSQKRPIPKFFIHSLSFDQIYSLNKSDDELFNFLSETRFNFSKNKDDYLIGLSNKRNFRKESLHKTRNISIFLLLHCINTRKLLSLISINWRNIPVILNVEILSKISTKLLIKIYFEYFLWEIVDLPIDATFITTQSSMNNLPTVFYMNRPNLMRKMIWYSTNNKPISEVNAVETDFPDFKGLAEFVDLNLVWEETDSIYLSSLGVTNTKAVGSMLFYPKKLKVRNNKKFTISYFDITPFEKFNGFLSEEMLIKNLLGIFEVVDSLKKNRGIDIVMNVKPKRSYSRLHSKKYIKIIDTISKDGRVNLLPSRTNLYELISESDFVFAVPFSSPALIAKELGVPTAYVCLLPRNYLLRDVNAIPVLTNKGELLDFIN
jgi:polysaccharide biosynthesis PFTS motif protein